MERGLSIPVFLVLYITFLTALANGTLETGGKVFLEGTQGFGLSLHHGHYPFVTGRETTAGTLCGDAGVSPLLVEDVIMVIRTYPIRVAGNSGPLRNEVDWETVTKMSGSSNDVVERTTVTNKVRRVAQFDLDLVKRAVLINRPTQMAVNFIDYIDVTNAGKHAFNDLSHKAVEFIKMLEEETGVPITLIGTGPKNEDIIDIRNQKLM